jgi:hypothetical protein
MTQTTETLSTTERVTEAKAIKSERDRKARELAERQEAEAAEEARLRAEKIAAGLLGVCPACKREVDTAEGIVLSHDDPRAWSIVAASRNLPSCRGTGEPMVVERDI